MPRIALLLLAALLSPVAFAARSLEPPKANEKWITLRADEFRFVSNVPPAKTLDIARDLLRMRAALGVVTNLKVRSALPTTVFIFANERAFGPYRDAVLQRKSDHTVGVFTGTQTEARMFDTVLVHSSDAKMVAHARAVLLMAEVRKVERLADERKPREAMALAKSLMERTTDESLKEHLAGFLQSLDAMAAAEVVNRAISHANAGNNVQALKILDEIMPTITDPDLRKEAERFRAEVAKRVMKKK